MERLSFSESSGLHLAFLGTFPPRKCGIATFTYDLTNSFRYYNRPNDLDHFVIAVNDLSNKYVYDKSIVRLDIREEDLDSYLQAADFINASEALIVCIQHEFGIFGGVGCDHLLKFLRRLRKPVVTTLHTVFSDPEPSYRNMTRQIAYNSSKIVVMSNRAIELLVTKYQISADRICLIPHGVPDVGRYRAEDFKNKLNIKKGPIVATFGLMSRNKGIEYALYALADIVKCNPEILYLIIGETHPRVIFESGQSYRSYLKKFIQKSGLQDNVLFIDRFLPLHELLMYLKCADVVLAPYISCDQIVSGTLAYALACGKAIISTPSLYAQEVLSDGRGIIVNFKDSRDIRKALLRIIENRKLKSKLEEASYNYGRRMIWSNVARAYMDLFYAIYKEITQNAPIA